jgi:hypothetical protein
MAQLALSIATPTGSVGEDVQVVGEVPVRVGVRVVIVFPFVKL